MVGRGVSFHDPVLGVEFPVAEGFTPAVVDAGSLAALRANSFFTLYGVSTTHTPERVVREAIRAAAAFSAALGAAAATPRIGRRGGEVVAVLDTPLGTLFAAGWRSEGLTRFYVAERREDAGHLRGLAERARKAPRARYGRRVIVDPMRGVPAYELEVPMGCRAGLRQGPAGLALEMRCGDARLVVETWEGVAGGPLVAQYAAASGYVVGEPPEPEALLPEGRWDAVLRLGAAPVSQLRRMEMLAYRLQGGPGGEAGALAVGEGVAAWAWVVVAALDMPVVGRVVLWSAGRALAEGAGAGSLLLTILAHLRPRRELAEALARESRAQLQAARRRIRESSMLTASLARSIHTTTPTIDPATSVYDTGDSGTDWSTSSDWGEAVDLDDSGLGGAAEDLEDRWGDTWSGQASYYLDQDGMLRNYDSGEEAVGELGAEGMVYDERGREIGWIEDGYIYDAETGEQVGVFHPEESDQYQMRLAEQNTGDPSRTYGYPDNPYAPQRTPINPYHTSTSRDDDEEE